MTALFDDAGRVVQLGAKLGTGGEATVFDLVGAPHLVAKRYHKTPSQRQAAKLAHMVRAANPELLKVAAWPQHTLRESSGRIVGFTMPRMSGFKELHELYGTTSRRTKFPDATWHFLVHVAMNCAAAFEVVHAAGAVVGDVNAKNVLASAEATVRLIDCDSFQLVAGADRFLCEVGVPEFTPPELQGKPFAGQLRTANHDAFGLAVLIFHLLFVGRHPFFGTFLGGGEMPQERAIQELRFAFGRGAAARLMRAPPHSLSMAALPDELGGLFERAFSETGVRAGRPSASHWLAALRGLTQQLTTCGVDPAHKYPAAAGACPWCALIAGGGPAFFVSRHLALDFRCDVGELTSLLAELRRLVQAQPEVQRLTTAGVPIPPSPMIAAPAPPLGWLFGFGAALVVSSILGTAAVLSPSSAKLVGAIIGGAAAVCMALWRSWRLASSAYGVERETRRAAVIATELELKQAALARVTESAKYGGFCRDLLARSDRTAATYAQLWPQYNAELATLASNLEVVQREAHLRCYEITDANIKGIGRVRKDNLIAFGIETAYDVLGDSLARVPGFGEKLQEAVMEWALDALAAFRFDPTRSVPDTERRALVARYRQRQIGLRGEVEKMISEARNAADWTKQHQQTQLDREVAAEARHRRAQAELQAMAPLSTRAHWLPLALVAVWLVVSAILPQSHPAPASALPPAPVTAVAAPAPEPFVPGMQLLSPGTGTPQSLRLAPRVGSKQRFELDIDAADLPKLTVRSLVAVRQAGPDGIVYQVLAESVRVVDARAAAPDVRGRIAGLASTLLSLTVSAQGELRSVKLVPNRCDAAVLEHFTQALGYMFVPTPPEPIAAGAQWRIRAQRSAPVRHREDATLTATRIDTMTGIKRTSALLTEPGSPSVTGMLEVVVERDQGDIIPTVLASYELHSASSNQRRHVEIRPVSRVVN